MPFRICSVASLSLLFLMTFGADATFAWDNEEGFVPLFDGESMDSFVKHGGKATYEIKDGTIIGTSTMNTPNTFLCTKKEYSDFVLKLEFKVDPKLNSGVQIRSHVYGEDAEVEINGKKRKRKAGTVHGYQVEIDPSPRAWTGGIYDESRRGWLNPLADNEAARKAFKQGEWNQFRIVCEGDSIKTFLNGVPAADLKDDMTDAGFIAFQVHGIGRDKSKAGTQVMWRNIRIRELD